MFLVWVSEQITDKGIGNGVSLIIFAGIVSLPQSLVQIFTQAKQGTISSFFFYYCCLFLLLG